MPDDNGAVTEWWLMQAGELAVVQHRSLQPAAPLLASDDVGPKRTGRKIDIEQLVNGIKIIHFERADAQS